MSIIVTVPGTPKVEARDPKCKLCAYKHFTPHLHEWDGTGRCSGRTSSTSYIQMYVDGILTCTCQNGQYSQGRRPRCWHSSAYEALRGQAVRPDSQRTRELKLEDLF